MSKANALTVKALKALGIYKQIKQLTTDLDELKVDFRDEAAGGKLEIPVEGVGKVRVASETPAKTVNGLDFDEAKFEALPQSQKDKLIKSGVVRRTRVTTAARVGAVSFELNT